jgi:hypothetical protein
MGQQTFIGKDKRYYIILFLNSQIAYVYIHLYSNHTMLNKTLDIEIISIIVYQKNNVNYVLSCGDFNGGLIVGASVIVLGELC